MLLTVYFICQRHIERLQCCQVSTVMSLMKQYINASMTQKQDPQYKMGEAPVCQTSPWLGLSDLVSMQGRECERTSSPRFGVRGRTCGLPSAFSFSSNATNMWLMNLFLYVTLSRYFFTCIAMNSSSKQEADHGRKQLAGHRPHGVNHSHRVGHRLVKILPDVCQLLLEPLRCLRLPETLKSAFRTLVKPEVLHLPDYIINPLEHFDVVVQRCEGDGQPLGLHITYACFGPSQ